MNVSQRGRFKVVEKETRPSTTAVLALFRSRWGEVDGYLPVLYSLKERHPDWKLIAMLMSRDLARQAAEQPFLFGQLEQVADVLIQPHFSSHVLAPRRSVKALWARVTGWLRHGTLLDYLKTQPIRLVLRDHTGDDRFLHRLNRIHRPRWVVYPHGTGLYIEPSSTPIRGFRRTAADLVLVGHEPELTCFRQMIGERPGRVFGAFGHPRYDRWWIDRLARAVGFQKSEETRRASRFKRTFLFATRGPSDKLLPLETFEELCQSVAEVVLKEPDNFLLVKPHPKQDLTLLKSQFARHDPDRWMISSFQTTQLASLADFVVCMVSGVILDALAVGKPTVEFFQYGPGAEYFHRDSSGQIISAYGRFGLVRSARTAKELEGLIDDCFSSRSEFWEEQRRATAAFMRLDNRSSDRVVDAIDNLLSSGHPSNP